MKKVIILMVSIIAISNSLLAQKASDILENGIRIKSERRLFLTYEDSIIKYYVAKDLNPPTNFVKLHDSTIFLANDDEIHIFFKPVNPLQFNYKQGIKYITDPVDSVAISAIGSIINVLDLLSPSGDVDFKDDSDSVELNKCNTILRLVDANFNKVHNRFKDDDIKKITTIFNTMKELSFNEEEATINKLKIIKSNIDFIKKNYEQTDSILDATRAITAILKKDTCILFIDSFLISSIIKDYESINLARKKRLENLEKVYKTVDEVQITASKGGDGLKWIIKVKPYEWKSGKISIHTITVSDGSYELSKENEIKSNESKKIQDKTYRIRKHRWFIPEVSIGSAYTFFNYNSFGTTSDSTGQQFVASPTENTVSNINVSTMLNYNLYIPNSQIHPLYQIGVGINSNIPTLFTGVGIRSNINGLSRIAFSGGIAMTWIQELGKLNVGDKVTGTDDINKDLKYQFSWPPKLYIGLQYNF